MRAARRWQFLIGLSLATPAVAQPATMVLEAVSKPVHGDAASATENLEFKLDRDDRMTVPVLLGGKGPYRFLVDTGADRTVVSTAIAAELSLTSGPIATLHSVTGTSQVRTANVPHLEVTHNRIRSLEAPLLERRHMGADGILGIDSLRSERIMFDFRNRTISIVPSVQRMERDEKGTIVVRGKLKRGHLIVTRASANGVPVTVVLDTGSEITLGNAALREKLERRKNLGPAQVVEMLSVTGEKLVGEAFFVKRVEIANVVLTNLVVMFSSAPIFGNLNLATRPAVLLGMNAMQGFDRVSIDFARKQLRVLIPAQTSLDTAVMASR